ncbi:MAG: YggT family protein [Gemmatimonadaceae bacterium]
MTGALTVFDTVLGGLRVAFFGIAALLAVICAIDWAVRTRRINPFGKVARFFRQSVDPAILPIERRVIRAGGAPSTAPWWALVFVVVGGIVVLSALQFVRDQVITAMVAAEGGSRGIYRVAVLWTFSLLQIALMVRVVVSWTSLSPYSKWVRWSFVLTEPILRPLRAIIPSLGMVDITPIIAYFLLQLIESALL